MKLLIDLQGAQTESRHRGIGRQARALAISLIEAAAGKHDIYILLNAGLRDGLDELRSTFLDVLPASHIKVFGIPGAVNEIEPANMWRMRAAEVHRETVIADIKPDVLYISSLFEGVSDDAVTSIGLMNAPYATAATLFDLIPLADPKAYLGAKFMQDFYYRRAQSLKRADHLVAISEFAKREAIEILQIPEERIDVALLAADPSFRKSDLSEAEIGTLRARYGLPEAFIFYVGAIEPRKNIPLILEAFGKLTPAERGEVALVFGGKLSDHERAQLQMAAVRFGVDLARLILPGFIAEVDLAPIYSLSSLFVFPSMQEGFGLPPLEAMACGAPVLVARNSSLPEVVGRDDQMFGTFDADDLAAKMARVFTDAAYASELRDWGIRRAADFSWERAGRETLTALERLHDRHRESPRAKTAFMPKPRLAFVSPLPSDRSGIADYASELLRELGCFYDVECILQGTAVSDPWVIANFPLRDVRYFRDNANRYDAVLYQLGNSEFHVHMFDLMIEIPGVVILHDFFLSGVFDWLGNTGKRSKDYFVRQLYLTHGLPALDYLAKEGRHAAAERYPANHTAFANSLGVIVHSQWSIDRAREIYGDSAVAKMARLPLLRSVEPVADKAQARQRLGIEADAFVVASFGFVAETKFGDSLLAAWALSKAGRAAGTSLVFVGDHPPGPWGEDFMRTMERMQDKLAISVTGYTDAQAYADYLAAADVAIQLRRQSRGETSRAVLDCMAAGLPVIVNAHGTTAEIDADTVLALPDVFSTRQLAEAIDGLFTDPDRRAALGAAAREEMRRLHHPAVVGQAVRDAIDRFTNDSASGRQAKLITAIGNLYAPVAPTETDLMKLSQTMAGARERVGLKRIFYDITLLAESDAHTGIERVVRSFLNQLLEQAPAGYRIEPVRSENGQLVYARHYIARKFGIPADVLPDSPIDYGAGDIYLAMEWAAYILPQMENYLRDFRMFGGRVVIGIYDLLPLQLPHCFPDSIPFAAQAWFRTALAVADDFMCISRTVADDVIRFGDALAKRRATPIRVGYFHLSADISGSIPTQGVPEDAELLLARLAREKTFLMVGTVEPRKGYLQVLDAFHTLWKRGFDGNLVIVGRQGWNVENVLRVIKGSRQYGKRMYWIQGASDEYLEKLYAASTALIAASEGEGFGLPLIEGAARGLPLIVRDLPVFHEVAGSSAYYFHATSGPELAEALMRWLAEYRAGTAPSSAGIEQRQWCDSAAQFEQGLFGGEPYGVIGGG